MGIKENEGGGKRGITLLTKSGRPRDAKSFEGHIVIRLKKNKGLTDRTLFKRKGDTAAINAAGPGDQRTRVSRATAE